MLETQLHLIQSQKHKLNRGAVGRIKFLETVLLNRGLLNGMLFSTVEEAQRWLLDE